MIEPSTRTTGAQLEGAPHGGRRARSDSDGHRSQFSDRPLLVFWETTKACALACAHCRACAQLEPGPDELITAGGLGAGRRARGSSAGPDRSSSSPGATASSATTSSRSCAYAQRQGVPVAISPSVTPELTARILDQTETSSACIAPRSASTVSNARTHDTLRGIAGHYEATLDAIKLLKDHGFTTQINTTVMAATSTSWRTSP